MDFIDTVFSFIPLLMIVFFFVRLAAAAKKKKAQKQSEPIPPGQQQPAPAGKEPEGQTPGSLIQSRLESLLQDKFPKRVPPPASSAPPVGDNRNTATAKPVRKPGPPAAQTLNTLENSREVNSVPAVAMKVENPRTRVNRLPELKRAVVWSEIIGKPKGLD